MPAMRFHNSKPSERRTLGLKSTDAYILQSFVPRFVPRSWWRVSRIPMYFRPSRIRNHRATRRWRLISTVARPTTRPMVSIRASLCRVMDPKSNADRTISKAHCRHWSACSAACTAVGRITWISRASPVLKARRRIDRSQREVGRGTGQRLSNWPGRLGSAEGGNGSHFYPKTHVLTEDFAGTSLVAALIGPAPWFA